MICALMGDHVKEEEIGCVHSAHVTTMKRYWQSNRDNYIMRRFVICALTGDHVKEEEIGCVHSAHVTTMERYHVKDLNILGRGG